MNQCFFGGSLGVGKRHNVLECLRAAPYDCGSYPAGSNEQQGWLIVVRAEKAVEAQLSLCRPVLRHSYCGL
jgi:hypothetical protein